MMHKPPATGAFLCLFLKSGQSPGSLESRGEKGYIRLWFSVAQSKSLP